MAKLHRKITVYTIVASLILNLIPTFASGNTIVFEDNFEGYSEGALPYGGSQKWSDFNSRGFTQWTPTVTTDPEDVNNTVLAIDKNTSSATTKNEYLKSVQSAVGGNVELSFKFYIPEAEGINQSNDNSIEIIGVDSANAALGLVDMGIKPASGGVVSRGQEGTVTKNEWHTAAMRVNTEEGIRAVYVDGNLLYESAVLNDLKGKRVGEFRVKVPGNQSEALIYIDDVAVTDIPLPEYISYEDILNGQEKNAVTQNLNLSNSINGYDVTWESSAPSSVSNEGVVSRPLYEDVNITLTASIKRNGEDTAFAVRAFNVTVKAQQPLSPTVFFEDDFTNYAEAPLLYGESEKWSDFNNRGFTQWTPSVAKDPEDENNNVLAVNKNTASADTKNEYLRSLQGTVNGKVEATFRFYIPTADGINISNDNNISVSAIDSENAALALVNIDIYPGSGSVNSQGQERNVSKNVWHTATLRVDTVNGTRETYLDGERIYSSAVIDSIKGKKVGEFRVKVPGNQSKALIYIDDVAVKEIPVPEYVKYEDILNGQDKASVTENLSLMTEHDIYNIAWASSEPSVVSIDGTVTPPLDDDCEVMLTATITRKSDNANLGTITFNITVPAPEYITYEDILNGQTKENVIDELNLLTQKDTFEITWESSDSSIIALNGAVTRPLLEDAYITLTAYIKRTGEDTPFATRTFNIIVQSTSQLYNEEFNFEDDFSLYSLGAIPYGGTQKWSDFSGRGFSQWIPTIAQDPLDASNQVLAVDKATASSGNLNQHFITNHEDITGRREVSFRFYVPSGMTTAGGRPYNAASDKYVNFALVDSEHAATFLIYTRLYVNSNGSPRLYSHGQSRNITFDSWNTLKMVLDTENKTHTTYLNNEILYTDVFTSGNAASEFRIVTEGTLSETLVYIDDFKLTKLVISDDGAVVRAGDDISLGDLTSVSDNFVLPSIGKYDTQIAWRSADSSAVEVVGNLAVVKREVGQTKTTTLTATVTRGNSQYERDFTVTLKPLSTTENLVKDFTFENIGGEQKEYYITQNLSLPNSYNGASVTWESSNTNAIKINGQVSQTHKDTPVKLTAYFMAGGVPFEKEFDVVVAAKGELLENEDFSAISTESQDINGYNNWEVEAPLGENGVSATIEREITDSIKSYDDSQKVLLIERTATKDEGANSNQKVKKKFTRGIKKEITAIDFDFMFTVDGGTLYCELEGLSRHYAITRTGIALKGMSETPFGTTLELNRWYHISVVQDAYLNTYDVYLDYEKVNGESIYAPGNATINGINFYSNVKTAIGHESFRLRRITVRDLTPDAQERVDTATANLTIGQIDYDKAKIELPLYAENNTSVSWKSSMPDVISEDGTVTRASASKTVTLTATVKKGNSKATKTFDVTVNATSGNESATQEIMQVIADYLTVDKITDENPLCLTKNLTLPSEITNGKAADIGGVNISWESNYPAIVSKDGIVTRQPYGGAATLTATLSAKRNPSLTVEKKFNFAVDTGGEVYFSYDFEDMPEESAGEDVTSWSTILKRPTAANTEYGSFFYADKEPAHSKLSHNDANHAMFLTRYTDAGLDAVTDMSHATVDNPLNGEYYYGDLLAMRVKMKFLSSKDSLKMTIYCLKERNYYLKPTSLVVSSDMLTYSYEEPLELDKWHDFLFYYDTLSSRMDIYVNGEYILSEPIEYGEGAGNYFNQWRFFNDSIGTIIVDDIEVRKVERQSDSEIVDAAVETVSIPSTITEDIELPSAVGNCSVMWKSSDESVISHSGKINPSPSKASQVTLTATFRSGETMRTETYSVNVPARNPFDREFSVGGINIVNNAVKGVNVKKMLSYSDDATLMVLVYNQNSLKKVYSFDVGQMNIDETREIPMDISLENMTNYKVKAFIWDGYETKDEMLSNTCYTD